MTFAALCTVWALPALAIGLGWLPNRAENPHYHFDCRVWLERQPRRSSASVSTGPSAGPFYRAFVRPRTWRTWTLNRLLLDGLGADYNHLCECSDQADPLCNLIFRHSPVIWLTPESLVVAVTPSLIQNNAIMKQALNTANLRVFMGAIGLDSVLCSIQHKLCYITQYFIQNLYKPAYIIYKFDLVLKYNRSSSSVRMMCLIWASYCELWQFYGFERMEKKVHFWTTSLQTELLI